MPGMNMKIIDYINDAVHEGRPFYSFEFFPPKTATGRENLFGRIDSMARLEPAFVDITWGAGGSTKAATLSICERAQHLAGLRVMLHITCAGLSRADIRAALEQAKAAGVRNVLALRGDPPVGDHELTPHPEGFAHASELVRFIRSEFGDWFCIAVAGFPEGHPDSPSLEADVANLKAKVEAGADFIITQVLFDAGMYAAFVGRCREAGIRCPILPGVMPIQSHAGFARIVEYCRVAVPDRVWELVQQAGEDYAAVKDVGVRVAIDLCSALLEAGAPGIHFYTLNLERSVRRVLAGLALEGKSRAARRLPWRASALPKRAKEDVRPIFWSNRPHSYLYRTATWDEFPNGRWGDVQSPAFGEMLDYHLSLLSLGRPEERREMWGETLLSAEDVGVVFARYVRGEISRLPWCDAPLAPETTTISDRLAALNKHGFLTINSQPLVHAASSDDPVFGWGGPGGHVYQKAYVEFFTSPELLRELMDECVRFPSLQYHAADHRGHTYTNSTTQGPTAVTWGVFPNKEVLQPTVVDPVSFLVWKDEAFDLWLRVWASAYDEESSAAEVLHSIHDTYFLVNVVDNDFVRGDIFALFEAVIRKRSAQSPGRQRDRTAEPADAAAS